jgi:signal recognition particle GTPase
VIVDNRRNGSISTIAMGGTQLVRAEKGSLLNPKDTLLVLDAMTARRGEHSRCLLREARGGRIILSKLDGDKAGAAPPYPSRRYGQPIKFIGVGEKRTRWKAFLSRQVRRGILGTGDVRLPVEKPRTSFYGNRPGTARKFRKGCSPLRISGTRYGR